MKSRIVAAVFLLLATGAWSQGLKDLAEGLGRGDHSTLRMRFEVTLMKIDVADIEVLLTPSVSSGIGDIAVGEGSKGDRIDQIAERLLDADTLMVRMTYLRDGDYGRFEKGIKSSLEAALKSESIDQREHDAIWVALSGELAPLADRGVMKGEDLVYHVDSDEFLMAVLTTEGEELLQVSCRGSEWADWIKGAFFGEESRFRKKLIESLLDDRN